jgi:hypothetical protein
VAAGLLSFGLTVPSESSGMRAVCILTGLIVSAVGLLAFLAHPTQMVPGMTLVTGMGLLYWGTFTLNRKSRRIFASKRRIFEP